MSYTKVIALYSPSGGGKTTITKELHKKVPHSSALYFDDRDYDVESGILDICQWVEEGADINRFQLHALAADITALQQKNMDFVFLDYPFGYRHKQIAPFISLSIFVDTPLDIALARRILRDFQNESVAAIMDDMDNYLIRGRNAYIHGNKTARADADFIVDGDLSLDDITERIISKINKI